MASGFQHDEAPAAARRCGGGAAFTGLLAERPSRRGFLGQALPFLSDRRSAKRIHNSRMGSVRALSANTGPNRLSVPNRKLLEQNCLI